MHRRIIAGRIAVVVVAAFLFVLSPVAAVIAHADGSQSANDQLRMVSIDAEEKVGVVPDNPVHFDATVDYQVSSVTQGLLVLFVLEDNATTATSNSSQGQWISSGNGVVHLSTDYQPSTPGMHTLTVVAGLFKDSKTLLAWTRTQPFSLNAVPGRPQFDKALVAYNAGQYANAIDDLTAAIQAAPKVGLYYCWRADSHSHLGQYDDAIADYTRALELTPKDRDCLLSRGIAYLWNGDQSQSIADLTAVINQTTTPDRWTAWALRARGVAYADLGDYANAISNYQAYLSLVPNAPDQSQIETWIGDLQSAENSGAAAPANSG